VLEEAMADEQKDPNVIERSTIGASFTKKRYIVILTVYAVLLTLAIIICIIQNWPPPTNTAATGNATDTTNTLTTTAKPEELSDIHIFFWRGIQLNHEAHLLLLVVLAAAAGSQVFVVRSFVTYVGERTLRNSWLLLYLLTPFAGMIVGLGFYLVIRGGFFSPTSTTENVSSYGFVAMGLLVGWFTDSAVLKLKKIAEAFFEKKEEGSDKAKNKPEDSSKPNP
jgi:hypothetical protein